ncbi:phosphotransferase [Knoellia koreensis]|uniref:Phosphotransferase n=1 Tax=Knoellia koreensis TaxID=2730921 RepID=A0A849HG09_9MICO|nr:phosphotransferase [Knoellia sp. DB2414S]
MPRWGPRLGEAHRLAGAQPKLRQILEALPQTLCHHDAVGANVLRSEDRTVLIDWESVGPGPVGADLASLLFASARRGDASARVVAATVEDAFEAYVEGLRVERPAVDVPLARRALDAAIALRWKLAADVASAIERGETPRRGSMPNESPMQSLEELSILVQVLLDAAHRALEEERRTGLGVVAEGPPLEEYPDGPHCGQGRRPAA